VSYTLRGRLESRVLPGLVAATAAAVLALAIHRWWPVEVAMLMIAVGLVLDVALYDRVLDYQPGWAALPFGALELGAVMGLAILLGVMAPLAGAIGFFVVAWLVAQALGHAILPRLRLSYADDGGEIGPAGIPAGLALAALFVAAGGVAFATRPPTVTLSAGVHQGPLVIDREEILAGKPGAIVRGGIVVRHSDVTIKNVTVLGGVNGITVEWAKRVKLENVRVIGASMDGIHVRFSQVMISDCAVTVAGPYAQGIDISYSAFQGMGSVEGCDVSGGREGIVVHSSMIMVSRNRVHGTSMHAINMSEMSMGEVARNSITGARGVGVYCGDHSECDINRNVVVGTRSDGTGNTAQAGVGIESNYYAEATLDHNVLVGNPAPTGVFANGLLEHR
jgi:parallel beta helix pectate lyase-like protein